MLQGESSHWGCILSPPLPGGTNLGKSFCASVSSSLKEEWETGGLYLRGRIDVPIRQDEACLACNPVPGIQGESEPHPTFSIPYSGNNQAKWNLP